MLNAMLHTIITEGLTDDQYIAGYTEGFDELDERIKEFPPEKMEADLRHPGRNPEGSGAALRALRNPRSSSGVWASASMSTAPTMRAA